MPEESSQEEGGKKGGFLSKWKGLAGWQKAGVLIAAAGLAIAIAMYFKNQPSNTTDGGTSTGVLGNGQTGETFPGAGEVFPSLPTTTSGGAATVPPTTTGATTPPAGTSTVHAPVSASPVVRSPAPSPVLSVPRSYAPPKTSLYSKSGTTYTSTNPSDISTMQRRLAASKAAQKLF